MICALVGNQRHASILSRRKDDVRFGRFSRKGQSRSSAVVVMQVRMGREDLTGRFTCQRVLEDELNRNSGPPITGLPIMVDESEVTPADAIVQYIGATGVGDCTPPIRTEAQ